LIGTHKRKEIYAFLYRTDLIKYKENSAFVYNDSKDVFTKEPFCGSFIAGTFDFVMCTIHTEFGDGKSEPRNEVYKAVSSDKEKDILIVGDFNLPENDPAWDELESIDSIDSITSALSVETSPPTTIGDKSYYDNIWYSKYSSEVIKGSGSFFQFDELIYTPEMKAEANRQVSDHRPISIKVKIK